VALGSCAGGLEAIRAILAKLPSDCGMALVVIQHLDPARRSVLRGLRSKVPPFPVLEVSNGIALQPNHVYVVSPDKKASIHNGTLLLGPITSRAAHHPIDDFMTELAATQGDKAIGVVLSGVGSDGQSGLAAIEAAGGITFAQDPETAQWPAMPLSAIKAGNVDFVLSPAQIGLELRRMESANERERARESRPESEEFTRAIIGAVLDAVFVMDKGGHILEFNPAAERIFGYRREEVLGRELTDTLVPPPLREEHRCTLARCLGAGKASMIGKDIHFTGMRADGSEVPIKLNIARTGLRTPMFVGLIRERTERQRAVEALRESEERFRIMADSAPVLIWMSGRDKLCTWFNEQWLRFVGRSMAQELGNGWAENVHPEDLERCLQIYSRHFDSREVFSMEYRLRRYDGEWRWVLDNGTPRYDSNKNFVGYIGSCVDITSLKLRQDQQIIVERKLRQRESELGALFDSSPDPHLRFDSTLRVTHANEAFEKASGIPIQLVIGKTGRELPLPQGDVKVEHDLISQVFRTGQPRRHEFLVQAAGGVTQHEVRYIPEFSPDGSVAAVLSVGRDITGRKRMEQALRQRESALSALFHSSPDAHARFDSNLRVTHANAAFEKAMGVSAQALIGKTVHQLPLSEDNRRTADVLINNVFRTGESQQYEFSLASTEGVTDYEVRYVPELSSDGAVAAVLGVGRDITERKRMERALQQRESELVALLDSSPDAHLRFDSNLRVTHANAAFGKAVGIAPDSVIGKKRRELPLPPGSKQVGTRLIDKVFQTGQPQRYEASIPSAEGAIEEEVRFVPELSPEGSVAAVLAIGRDITERKRMERDLRQREQELAALFDNSPDVIVRRDRNLRNLYVNAAWERLTGIARKIAIGKTSEELGLPKATVTLQRRAIRHILKTRCPLTLEFTYPSPKGPVDHEVRHIPEFDASGVCSILSIGRDVTEQKRLQKLAAANERDIRALSASLITAQEQERRRIAREIHDSLLQHLGSLAAEIGGVASELAASSSAGRRLQAARDRALRAAEETRKIARQLHPAILEDLGLPKALQNLCSEFSQREGISVKLQVIDPVPEAPIETASCLYRIAQEALNNVGRHADAQNVWVRLSGTRKLRLMVHDDGIGFDADSVRGAGGLGLVSMKERARIAGAKLSIRGHTGHGTLVDLVLPIPGATRGKSAHSAGR